MCAVLRHKIGIHGSGQAGKVAPSVEPKHPPGAVSHGCEMSARETSVHVSTLGLSTASKIKNSVRGVDADTSGIEMPCVGETASTKLSTVPAGVLE